MVIMDMAASGSASSASNEASSNNLRIQSEASKMLEAALQQMDGIISSESTEMFLYLFEIELPLLKRIFILEIE